VEKQQWVPFCTAN